MNKSGQYSQRVSETHITMALESKPAGTVLGEIVRFIVVGTVGFLVDAGLLTLAMRSGWTIFPARLLSFALAVTCTWFLNRTWTFARAQTRSASREYSYYLLTQVVGAAINLTVFFVLVAKVTWLIEWPVIPLAIGAGVSLCFTFIMSKRLVFAR